MDYTVISSNIGGEVSELSEGLLSNDGVVDEILTELTGVSEALSGCGGKRGGRDRSGGDLSGNDAVVDCVSIERSTGKLVRLNSGIGGCEYSEGSCSSKVSSYTGFLKSLNEESEVIVSLKVSLLESRSDSISSPNLSRSLKSSKGVYNVCVKSKGGTSLKLCDVM